MPLVVLEGIDASGKKTQAELLVKRLKKSGRKAVLIDFPSYETPFGKLVASYLKGEFGPRETISRKFASLLYALDRYSRAEEIKEYLKKGFTIVLDRYTPANLAFQTAEMGASERKKMLAWIDCVESGLPQPDAVVFLDVPPRTSLGLIETRADKIKGVKKDIHEKDSSYVARVYTNYLRLSKERKWIIVKCMAAHGLKTKEEISDLIFFALRRRKVL